jgi:outer membrane protein assembly factor BamB
MTCCRAGLLLFVAWLGATAEWPRFRGPNGSGVDSSTGYPVEFSPSRNVVWKAPVPYGQSSPIVAGNRVYVTASEDEKLVTIALDAKTGHELWRRGVTRDRTQKIFRANDPASPTPVADSSGVVAFFPDFGVVAYAPDGRERWTHHLGPFKNFYGIASSPVMEGDLVVLICDQQTGSFAIALDRDSGRQRWRTERTGMTVGWATPAIFRPKSGSAELIVPGTTRIDSYYLATGERHWWMPVGSMGALGTPVVDGDTLFVETVGTNDPWLPPFATILAKYDKDKDGRISWDEFHNDPDLGEHFGWIDSNSDNFIDEKEWNAARMLGQGDHGVFALRPQQARGQLAPTAVRWRFEKAMAYIPAPLLYRDVYYMVATGGIVTALNASTGEVLKRGRSAEALGEYFASPVAADGKVYLVNEEGKVSVLKAGGQWDVLRVNDLREEVHSTPALSGGRIYVRTRSKLYCFGTAE